MNMERGGCVKRRPPDICEQQIRVFFGILKEMNAIIGKWGLICVIFGVCALAVFGLFRNAWAVSVDDLKLQIDAKNEEIKKIQEEIRGYNEEISKKNKTANTLKNKITTLNGSIMNLRRNISLTEAKISQKKLEIRELEIFILDKEVAIAEKRQTIASTLRVFFERERRGLLSFLAEGASLSDVFGYFDQSENFQKELNGAIVSLRDLKQELEENRSVAEARQGELTKFQGELSDKKIITELEKKEQQGVLTQTKNQEKRYQELLAEREKQFDEIQREIEGLEEELRKQVDPSSLPPRREGFFAMPTRGRATQGYGETPFAKNSHFYKFHNGIDIAAPTGMEVIAAAGGRVIAVGNSDSYCPRGAYGKYIVVDHGNNLATLYAHLSLQKASEGQDVARGERIGYVGSTGRSTGPHLHFTVYDMRTLELKRSKLCGILPYGGSINPNGYL